jgi:PadR family transcriptional regulator, regulatory protein PadR
MSVRHTCDWVIVVSRAEHRYCDGTQDPGATMPKMKHQELLKGLIRLHILHHASKAEFYGQWMIHELARHGYTLSPGTLYPMLHSLERSGYLKSKSERLGRTFRRVYRATALGKEANKIAKIQVRELTGGRR